MSNSDRRSSPLVGRAVWPAPRPQDRVLPTRGLSHTPGVLHRCVAEALNLLVLVLVFFLIRLVAGSFTHLSKLSESEIGLGAVLLVIAAFLAYKFGCIPSPGDRLTGLQVVDATTRLPLRAGQSAKRGVVSLIVFSVAPSLLGLPFIVNLVLIGKHRRSLADFAASTMVIVTSLDPPAAIVWRRIRRR